MITLNLFFFFVFGSLFVWYVFFLTDAPLTSYDKFWLVLNIICLSALQIKIISSSICIYRPTAWLYGQSNVVCLVFFWHKCWILSYHLNCSVKPQTAETFYVKDAKGVKTYLFDGNYIVLPKCIIFFYVIRFLKINRKLMI